VKARIVAANLRDLSYIAANLRPADKAEIDCQHPGWTPAALALASLNGPAFVVELSGNPEAAFGAVEQRQGLWIVWAWGTRRMGRCVPAIKRFGRGVLLPELIARGACRGEARALATHGSAHTLLRHLGATQRCELPCFGIGGETFLLFDWTRNDVLFDAGTSKTATAAPGAQRQ